MGKLKQGFPFVYNGTPVAQLEWLKVHLPVLVQHFRRAPECDRCKSRRAKLIAPARKLDEADLTDASPNLPSRQLCPTIVVFTWTQIIVNKGPIRLKVPRANAPIGRF